MSESKPSWSERWFAFRNTKLGDPKFQRWASSFPPTRAIAARRAKGLFDISAGFIYSQVLLACVRLELFEALAPGPMTPEAIASRVALPMPALMRLLGAAAAIHLVEKRPDGRYGLGVHGAAYIGNPAIGAMIEHHALVYRDLADPVALLRGEKNETALAEFWPYARSESPGAVTPEAAKPYTTLMSETQALIADDVLDAYPFTSHHTLMDVGGGDGAFLIAATKRRPDLDTILFDLPAVAARASERFRDAHLAGRGKAVGGDFKSDPLPTGADLVALIRVAHDHDDATVAALLAKIWSALPPGGVLLLAEPLANTPGAESVGAYFSFYLMAMQQGRPRTEAELQAMLYAAGFARVRLVKTARPMLTSLIVAQKSAGPANRTVRSS